MTPVQTALFDSEWLITYQNRLGKFLAACFAPNQIIAQGRHGRIDAVGADACGVFVVAVDMVGVGVKAHLLHHRLRQCLFLYDIEFKFLQNLIQ